MTSYAPPAAVLVERMTAAAANDPAAAVAFQGAPGAYSHQAVRELFPGASALPCLSFEDALEAVQTGKAGRAVIPIENSLHGRVADVHFLLPESGLFIVAEHFVRVRHCLLGRGGRAGITRAYSHPQALGQTRKRCRDWGIEQVAYFDTAAAAAYVASENDPGMAAIASSLAAELYGLDIIAEGIEDIDHNTTRFVVLEREALTPPYDSACMMSFSFAVRNVPAALFKALGGFATNGVNMTKLESYLRDGGFSAAEFYADIVGRPEDAAVARAMEELAFHTKWIKLHGTYPAARPRG